MKRLALIVRKILSAIFLLIVVVSILNYALQVSFRSSAKRWYPQVSDEDGGIYTVQYARVAENWISFRLYRTGGNEVLAERTYQFIGSPNFVWTHDALIYDTSADSFYNTGFVQLPPTRLDRWLAWLP